MTGISPPEARKPEARGTEARGEGRGGILGRLEMEEYGNKRERQGGVVVYQGQKRRWLIAREEK